MISTPERETFERGRLPVAPRDKRPALAALALLLILLGALGSALLVFRSGDRESVLAASHDIAFGQVVTRDDFSTVRAAADGAALVPANLVDTYVGTRATSAIPEGALLSPKMFNRDTLVPEDGEGVGIVVDATRRPSQVPSTGQVWEEFKPHFDKLNTALQEGRDDIRTQHNNIALATGESASI